MSPSGMGGIPRLQAKGRLRKCGRVRRCRIGVHTKFDQKVHLVRIPKDRMKVLRCDMVIRVRDLLHQIAVEHEPDPVG